MGKGDASTVIEAIGKITAIHPGTTIPHLVMEEMLGVQRLKEPQRYYRLVRMVRADLERNYGLFLHTEKAIGYSILAPGDEMGECIQDIQRGTKRIVRGAMRSQLVRVERIEDPEKRTKTINMAQRTANLAMMLKNGVKEFIKPSEPVATLPG